MFQLIHESWEALKLNIGTFIVLALLLALITVVSIPFLLFLPIVTDGKPVSIFISITVILLLIVIGCILLPAITIAQIESARGNKISVTETLERSKGLFLSYIVLMIIVGLAIVIGFLFFAIPGLLAMFFFSLSGYILVDKKVSSIEAIKGSFELVKSKWQWVAALFIVQLALSLIGCIPFIGWILSLVLSIAYFCLPAVVYTKISTGKK